MKTIQIRRENISRDALISIHGKDLFSTSQIDYLLKSPLTLTENGSAILLDASYSWFDSCRNPEILRIERDGSNIKILGRKRFHDINVDSDTQFGSYLFSDWVFAVKEFSEKENH